MTAQTVSLRHATSADERTLERLAALDSTRLPAGPFLIAEVEGTAHAALSLSDGSAIADPFEPTAELVELLRNHGAAKASDRRRGRLSRSRRPRLALGF
jgi:hypothetical protein